MTIKHVCAWKATNKSVKRCKIGGEVLRYKGICMSTLTDDRKQCKKTKMIYVKCTCK